MKGVCVGKLVIKGYGKELAECFYEININKMADDTWKRAFFFFLPVVGIVWSLMLTNVIDRPAASMIENTISNGAGLFISRPRYGFDKALAPIETIIFGEPIRIIIDNRLLFFGNPMDNITEAL